MRSAGIGIGVDNIHFQYDNTIDLLHIVHCLPQPSIVTGPMCFDPNILSSHTSSYDREWNASFTVSLLCCVNIEAGETRKY